MCPISEIDQQLKEVLAEAASVCLSQSVDASDVPFENPRQESHGDLASSFVLKAAKAAKTNPRELGQKIVSSLENVLEDKKLKRLVEKV